MVILTKYVRKKAFDSTEKKDLIESKKKICLNDFLWFKEMICLN